MRTYEIFATTADLGIRAWGDSHSQLLENMIRGLNQLVWGREPASAGTSSSHTFHFRGDSWENVLINLITEVLFLFYQTRRMVSRIECRTGPECMLDAELKLIAEAKEPEIEVKSATYHNLKIQSQEGLLSAEVVLDV